MAGDMVPCLFGTLTSQRYHWDEVIRIIAEVEGIDDHKSLSKGKRRELVNKYPLFVSWYCALRLELTLKTIVVPTFGASAFFAVYEWSPTGAMVHVHYVLWKPGAPRFDLRAEKLQQHHCAITYTRRKPTSALRSQNGSQTMHPSTGFPSGSTNPV